MFHASRWHENPRFNTPMALLDNGIHVFICDCVTCLHPWLHTVTSLIVRLYYKVRKFLKIYTGLYAENLQRGSELAVF